MCCRAPSPNDGCSHKHRSLPAHCQRGCTEQAELKRHTQTLAIAKDAKAATGVDGMEAIVGKQFHAFDGSDWLKLASAAALCRMASILITLVRCPTADGDTTTRTHTRSSRSLQR